MGGAQNGGSLPFMIDGNLAYVGIRIAHVVCREEFMNELVERLATGDHPVAVTIRPEPTLKALKECIDRGYVHVKFTGTRGGTELGVRLDRSLSELGAGDFDTGSGTIEIVGNLTLNYEKVRCRAQIDLHTFTGRGHLEVIKDQVPTVQSA